MGYFSTYFGAYFDRPAQSPGVQPIWCVFATPLPQQLERPRRKIQRAVDREIAARLAGKRAVPAEVVARRYFEEFRRYIREAAARDAAFRAFLRRQSLEQAETLEQMLRIERAIRAEIRRRRDDEDWLILSALAA